MVSQPLNLFRLPREAGEASQFVVVEKEVRLPVLHTRQASEPVAALPPTTTNVVAAFSAASAATDASTSRSVRRLDDRRRRSTSRIESQTTWRVQGTCIGTAGGNDQQECDQCCLHGFGLLVPSWVGRPASPQFSERPGANALMSDAHERDLWIPCLWEANHQLPRQTAGGAGIQALERHDSGCRRRAETLDSPACPDKKMHRLRGRPSELPIPARP